MGLVRILCITSITSVYIHHFIQTYDPSITFVLKKLFKISLQDAKIKDDGLAIKMSPQYHLGNHQALAQQAVWL